MSEEETVKRTDLRMFLLRQSTKSMIVNAPDEATAKLLALARTNDMQWYSDKITITELKMGTVMDILVGPF